ncbi:MULTISPECIES: hypothetical protein [unclassified Legionella]|uniref:hypothetical protein n=1 Tax=unclassified Legionella TaxID=2622702 RepID=UPI001055D5CC|nr:MULTISPECIES: hypothetical protein [unclassified Legionella]MDI9817874.1 hypothetical protein [Legionella sp. PL877]
MASSTNLMLAKMNSSSKAHEEQLSETVTEAAVCASGLAPSNPLHDSDKKELSIAEILNQCLTNKNKLDKTPMS